MHGDFWDNNIRFRHQQIALVTDFDFLGEHPRTDDLALTLYCTSIDITDITRHPAQLTDLIRAYEAGLGTRLSQHERAAIPLAMARQPLWSIAVWVALLTTKTQPGATSLLLTALLSGHQIMINGHALCPSLSFVRVCVARRAHDLRERRVEAVDFSPPGSTR